MEAEPDVAVEPRPTKPERPGRRSRRRAEITAGIILAIATVLTAWAGFQNAQWVRERFALSDEASTAGLEAAELAIGADLDSQWDRAVFVGLASAVIDGNEIERRAHEALVRDGVRPLVEAWVRWYQRDPAAALEVDPYRMGVYDVEQRRNRASEARQVAAEKSQASRVASRNGADYALLMVFFAGALTFVGLTALFHQRRVRWLVLGLATLAVVGGLLVLVQLPVLT